MTDLPAAQEGIKKQAVSLAKAESLSMLNRYLIRYLRKFKVVKYTCVPVADCNNSQTH